MQTTRLLLIDDDRMRSAELIGACRQRGWEVIRSSGSKDVRHLAANDHADVVLLNSQIGAKAVEESLSILRAAPDTAHLPIAGLDSARNSLHRWAENLRLVLPADADTDQILDALANLARTPEEPLVAPAEVIRDGTRLQAVTSTALVKQEQHPSFDRLTQIASRILRAPVVLLSTVEANRQFFSGQVGLPAPWAERRETPLSHSFCQWVVSDQRALIVEDARQHNILKNNLAIRDLGVIAYAGVPVKVGIPSQPAGSFCAIDSEPRNWLQTEVQLLDEFARLIEGQLLALHDEADDTKVRAPTRVANAISIHATALSALEAIRDRAGERLSPDEQSVLRDIQTLQKHRITRDLEALQYA